MRSSSPSACCSPGCQVLQGITPAFKLVRSENERIGNLLSVRGGELTLELALLRVDLDGNAGLTQA